MRPVEYGHMYEAEENFWWYLGMRHNVFTLLQRYWDWQSQPSPTVLDAGCGTGGNLARLATGWGGQIGTQKAVGFDLSAQALEFCQKRGLGDRIVRGSITEMPLPSNWADIVVSCDVLSNLPDDTEGWRELSRVMRHGGIAVLNLPAYQSLLSEHDQAVRTVHRYNKDEVRRKLAENGLMPLRMSYVNTLLFLPAAGIRIFKRGKLAAKSEQELQNDLTPPAPLINSTLRRIMAAEASLLGRTNFNLPFGLSLMTVARKI